MTTTSTELTAALKALPQEWALTPVNQKKAYFAGWPQTGLARESIKQAQKPKTAPPKPTRKPEQKDSN